jgi:GAF domain-containing protein/CheY-like chemotaxis protein
MSDKPIKVLLVEDNPQDALLMRRMLAKAGDDSLDLESADCLSTGLERLAEGGIAVVLLDLSLPDSHGLETFARVHARAPQVPIIVLSGFDDRVLAVRAVREGAQDYLVKGNVDPDLLVRAIRYAIERKRAEEALRQYADGQAALYAVTSAAATLLDPDELLSTVLDVVLSVLSSDAGWVALPGPTLDEPPRIVAWRGVSESFVAAEESVPLRACPVCAPLLVGSEAQVEPAMLAGCPRLPRDVLSSAGLHSHVGVPLYTGEEVLGILHVAWRAPRPYSEADRALLMTIGQQVGVALHNANLYQAARQVDRLQALNDLDQALAATLDPDKVVEVTLHQIAAVMDAPMGALLVVSPQASARPERLFTLEQGWTELTILEEDAQRLQALLRRLQDGRRAAPLSSDELATLSGRPGLAQRWDANGLVVPVWGDEALLAVLALGGRPAGWSFTEEDRALAQAAANRAGQAIQNARLYQASQQQSARLATLNAISIAAVSSLELDAVLHHVMELTCQELDAAEGSIILSERDTGKLFFAVTLPDDSSTRWRQRLAPGQGIVGWVVEHGQPVCVNDVRRDPRFYDGVDVATGFETRSLLCAPLKHVGKITGAIEVVNKRQGEFTADDLSLLEAVASIAAVALENARLYTATRARADELALLNEVGLALTSTLDYSTVVHAALNQIQRLFRADRVSLLQLDPQSGELHFVRTLVGGTPFEIPVRLALGEGITGWALEQRQPVMVEDAQRDPRFLEWVDQHVGSQTRSFMAVPLLGLERAIGVIAVTSSEPGIYTRRELRTLQALASTLAVALDNASLYDEQKGLLREREQAQAQLIHAEKMAALGRLVASIAHEINNPLQAVQGCLMLAEEELDEQQRRETMQRYLGVAGSEIERISTIVRRMRDFYRPAREGLQSTDLHATLESVLELINKQLQHSEVTVQREWAEELPVVQANPDHLKQVFLNLVINAIDAMPAGGMLHISTGLAQIQVGSDEQPRPAVRVEFTDTGEGMSPETQSRIFEPFFTTKERGTGLGLSISYGIIQACNGEITVTSQVGEGTTFTILLPVGPV